MRSSVIQLKYGRDQGTSEWSCQLHFLEEATELFPPITLAPLLDVELITWVGEVSRVSDVRGDVRGFPLCRVGPASP